MHDKNKLYQMYLDFYMAEINRKNLLREKIGIPFTLFTTIYMFSIKIFYDFSDKLTNDILLGIYYTLLIMFVAVCFEILFKIFNYIGTKEILYLPPLTEVRADEIEGFEWFNKKERLDEANEFYVNNMIDVFAKCQADLRNNNAATVEQYRKIINYMKNSLTLPIFLIIIFILDSLMKGGI